MKRNAFYHPFTFLLAFILLITACSKEGPVGPAGPAGPAGPTGAGGAQGPKGDTGTANVIYSAWLDVTFNINQDTSAFVGIINAPRITNPVLTNGVIKVYFNLSTAAAPVIVPIPYFDGEILINPVFLLQRIQLISNENVSSTVNTTGVKVQQYRYVIIPGGTTARSMVDLNNYQEVKKHYNIPD